MKEINGLRREKGGNDHSRIVTEVGLLEGGGERQEIKAEAKEGRRRGFRKKKGVKKEEREKRQNGG